jgi:hypothetical protein
MQESFYFKVDHFSVILRREKEHHSIWFLFTVEMLLKLLALRLRVRIQYLIAPIIRTHIYTYISLDDTTLSCLIVFTLRYPVYLCSHYVILFNCVHTTLSCLFAFTLRYPVYLCLHYVIMFICVHTTL